MSVLLSEAGSAFDSGANDPVAVFVRQSQVQSTQLRRDSSPTGSHRFSLPETKVTAASRVGGTTPYDPRESSLMADTGCVRLRLSERVVLSRPYYCRYSAIERSNDHENSLTPGQQNDEA